MNCGILQYLGMLAEGSLLVTIIIKEQRSKLSQDIITTE